MRVLSALLIVAGILAAGAKAIQTGAGLLFGAVVLAVALIVWRAK